MGNRGFYGYKPDDRTLLTPDTCPTNPHPWDDEFDNDGVLDGKWTAVNYNGANTVERIGDSRYCLADIARNTRLMGIEQALGSPGKFKIRCKVETEMGTADYNGFGIGFKNAGNGRYVWFGVLHHSSHGYMSPCVIRCSDALTYVSEADSDCWVINNRFYLEVEYDGTSLLCKISTSGYNFATVLTEAVGAGYLAAAPTHFGPMVHHYGIYLMASWDWIRCIQ